MVSVISNFLQFCLRFAGLESEPLHPPVPVEIPIEDEETEILEVKKPSEEISDELLASQPRYPDKIICPERGYVFLGHEMLHDFYAGTEIPHPHGGFYPPSLIVIGMNDFFLTGWAAFASDYAINGKKLLAICWRKAREQNIIEENPRAPFAHKASTPDHFHEPVVKTIGPETSEESYLPVKFVEHKNLWPKYEPHKMSEEDAFFREILPPEES